MCGIVGLFSKENIDANNVREALNLIRHRGPDDLQIIKGDNFCGGTVRLAIEEIKNGQQPIQNERYIIGFNGEIFNYKSLTLQYGFNPKYVNSEIKFLLTAWEAKKESIFADIEGQFAIFVYDKVEKKLTLSRDPYGIRPLFYSLNGDECAFCSEAKGIFRILRKKSIDYHSIEILNKYVL